MGVRRLRELIWRDPKDRRHVWYLAIALDQPLESWGQPRFVGWSLRLYPRNDREWDVSWAGGDASKTMGTPRRPQWGFGGGSGPHAFHTGWSAPMPDPDYAVPLRPPEAALRKMGMQGLLSLERAIRSLNKKLPYLQLRLTDEPGSVRANPAPAELWIHETPAALVETAARLGKQTARAQARLLRDLSAARPETIVRALPEVFVNAATALLCADTLEALITISSDPSPHDWALVLQRAARLQRASSAWADDVLRRLGRLAPEHIVLPEDTRAQALRGVTRTVARAARDLGEALVRGRLVDDAWRARMRAKLAARSTAAGLPKRSRRTVADDLDAVLHEMRLDTARLEDDFDVAVREFAFGEYAGVKSISHMIQHASRISYMILHAMTPVNENLALLEIPGLVRLVKRFTNLGHHVRRAGVR